jgi:RHS repeat-associated protein
LYHVLTDQLGSLSVTINADTDSVNYYSFNVWGVPREYDDWTTEYTDTLFAGRGYTMHEHLMEFNLINMNGRVYDPVVGRFLSPDPFVQAPGYANSFNRYAYVLNNPLMYTDPSGYRREPYHYDSDQPWNSNLSSGMDSRPWEANYSRMNEYMYASIFSKNFNIMYNNPDGGYWDYTMSKPYLFKNGNEALDHASEIDPDIEKSVLGTGSLGSQYILYENKRTGFMSVVKTPFWQLTGSYYNSDYFMSGVQAYGDIKLIARMMKSKFSAASLFPAAWSWEINGSVEGGIAGSLSLIGGIIAIRGKDAGKYKSFISAGGGGGGVSVSAQVVATSYYYFGDISNFTLNDFVGVSVDFDVTGGEGFVGGGVLSFMLGSGSDFIIGFGKSLGIGIGSPVSGSGTIQYTEFY